MNNTSNEVPENGALTTMQPPFGSIQPQPANPSNPAGLKANEVAWLGAFSTPEEIEELASNRRGKPKAKQAKEVGHLNKVLLTSRDLLLQCSGGKPLFSAKVAGEILVRAGLYKRPDRMNSVGDHLGNGTYGHHCPVVELGSKNYYYVPALGKTRAEKEAMQKELDGLAKDVLRRGVAVILPTSEGSEDDEEQSPVNDGADSVGAGFETALMATEVPSEQN